jgi:thiol-disulfide isomerase/thioredoxin/outer membrane lipoprotein-sorting protein
MRRQLQVATALLMMSSAIALAQTASSTSSAGGLQLLQYVAQQYSDAKSYYIESVEERTSNGEYDRSWQKTLLTAAEAPANRSYYEGRSPTGTTIRVADGKTVWTYRVDEHRYTVKQQLIATSNQPTMIALSEGAMVQAKHLKLKWTDLARSLKSANRLPDETLKVNGHRVRCDVVRIRTSDLKPVVVNRVGDGYTLDELIWIDKSHATILRTVEQVHTVLLSGAARTPMQEEITTTFTTSLDGAVRENLFTFAPPAGAKLIRDFPDPQHDFGAGNMAGDQIPSLQLKASDGKTVSIESFRGKPVLLDFWATWCGPCVASLPRLAQIYREAKAKGLVLLAVDQDEKPNTAAEFLSKQGYDWPNYHDDNGEIEKLMGSSPVPRTVLIDSQGKIAYDAVGSTSDELRTQIARLGPE